MTTEDSFVNRFFKALVGAGAILAFAELIVRPALTGLMRVLG